jgi:hypothetical protein
LQSLPPFDKIQVATPPEAAESGSFLFNEFDRERSVEIWLPPKGYISFVPSVLRGSM